VGAKGAFLRCLFLLIPPNSPIGAGMDKVFLPFGSDRIYENDAVLPFIDGAMFCAFNARCVVTVHTRNGEIGHIHHGCLPPLLPHNIDPSMPVSRLSLGHSRKFIIYMFILAGKKTVVTILTFFHIDH
jgi:hypothetical protein